MQEILRLTVILSGLVIAVQPSLDTAWFQEYHSVNGSLCISSQFTETQDTNYCSVCAMLCSLNKRCQAFTTADGPCQLFVFDKCSKSVRNCSCSRRGRLFVKRQSGLEPGALCPSGYGDELCGVKYKMLTSTGVWAEQKQRCESDGGLAMMADVINSAEMSHVELLTTKYGIQTFYLGGQQLPGSVEPAGGWLWSGCNITLDGSLWAIGQPDNSGSNVDIVMRGSGLVNLSDGIHTAERAALCECVSPFD